MGDGVGSVHCFFERAGDVAHHGQAKEHSEQNTGHHRADRQGTHVVIAGGGGGVLFLGLVELQLQQTAHVFPQWGVGRAHYFVVQLFAQVEVACLQRSHGGLEPFFHEFAALCREFVGQPLFLRRQLGGCVGGPERVVFRQICGNFSGGALHFFRGEIGQGVGQGQTVFQQVGLHLGQLSQGHRTVFVHGA